MKLQTTIPMRTHLKKYILHRYNQQTIIRVSKKHIIGKLIIKSFSELKNTTKDVRDLKSNIVIIFDHINELTLSEGNVFDFNQLIEDFYRKDLAYYIGVEKLWNKNYRRIEAIGNFNSKFGINESDIALETLVKHLQRHEQDTQVLKSQRYNK